MTEDAVADGPEGEEDDGACEEVTTPAPGRTQRRDAAAAWRRGGRGGLLGGS